MGISISNELIRVANEILAFQDEYDIEDSLSHFELSEYSHFVQLHEGEWICAPVNRNANVPFIYVEQLSDGLIVAGYSYLDGDENGYEGTPQESVTGLLEELAHIKNDIEQIAVSARNELLDKSMAESVPEEEPAEEEQGAGLDDEDRV